MVRIWEYTGKVRRGYFVEGLSGAQFVRTEEFEGVMLALEQPRRDIQWLCAADPMQAWGKILPHPSALREFCGKHHNCAYKCNNCANTVNERFIVPAFFTQLCPLDKHAGLRECKRNKNAYGIKRNERMGIGAEDDQEQGSHDEDEHNAV